LCPEGNVKAGVSRCQSAPSGNMKDVVLYRTGSRFLHPVTGSPTIKHLMLSKAG